MATNPKTRQKTRATTVDSLADTLASSLTIKNVKGKQKANPSPLSEPGNRLEYMRSFNAALQELSLIVQSGWKLRDGELTPANVRTAIRQADKHLRGLRTMSKGTVEVDVERAALSLLGKYVAVEMHDLELEALEILYPRICTLLGVTPPKPQLSSEMRLLSIPLPSALPSDAVLLTMVSTYLSHAISILAHPSTLPTNNGIEMLSNALTSSPTLLKWLPSISPLPEKFIDSILTKAYTSLTKCSNVESKTQPPPPPPVSKSKRPVETNRPNNQLHIFNIRIYALSCLMHTTPGIIDPNTFWAQATRFGMSFVKSTSSTEEQDKALGTILTAYTDFVSQAELRADAEVFLCVNPSGDGKEKGFLAFCDYWMGLAKHAGEISVLDRITRLTRHRAGRSSPTTLQEHPRPIDQPLRDVTGIIADGTCLCASFSQTTVWLEQLDKMATVNDQEVLSRTEECIKAFTMSSLRILLAASMANNVDQKEDLRRVSGKVDRALERLRRAALRILESSSGSNVRRVDAGKGVRRILESCIDTLQQLTNTPTTDLLTRLLDTLFVLSRTTANVHDPRTFIPSYDYLSRASTVLNSVLTSYNFPATSEHDAQETSTISKYDIANYLRCVSGAFHNIAGQLYQSGRYGAAVPFLKESCELGRKAVDLKLQEPVTQQMARMKEEARKKDEGAWKQLEEQLCRRWELLGVCYLKNGDRKEAYAAFVQYVCTFSYQHSGFWAARNTEFTTTLFSTPSISQLGSIIDKLTYTAACDLLLGATDVSLRTIATSHESCANDHLVDTAIIGAIIERQIDSLEPSIWKPGVHAVFAGLLRDSLEVYSSEEMPIRRARILVRSLEYLYRDGGGSDSDFPSPNEIGEEVGRLLAKDDLGRDSFFAFYRLQCRASAQLWLSLHAHKTDPTECFLMEQHSRRAVELLKELISTETCFATSKVKSLALGRGSAGTKVKVKKTVQVASPKGRVRPQRVPAAPKKAVSSRSKKDPVTPKTPRAALQPVSTNVTPPRQSLNGEGPRSNEASFVLHDFDRLLSLLQLTSRVLGVLVLTLPKIQVLDVTKKLCDMHSENTNDDSILVSIELAHEYSKLGKSKRADKIFSRALKSAKAGGVSEEVCILLLLRYGECSARTEDIYRSSSFYCEAIDLAERCEGEDKTLPTIQRIQGRVKRLERVATASHLFGLIQFSKENFSECLQGMLQSLRLWNRAYDALARLAPSSDSNSVEDSNPFEISKFKSASSSDKPSSNQDSEYKQRPRRTQVDELGWRVSEGLLSTFFTLCQLYLLRGSPREAEYFVQQAYDLAEALRSIPMMSRALVRKGELQILQGLLEEGHASFVEAAELLHDTRGIDTATMFRLRGLFHEKNDQQDNARELYGSAISILDELEATFQASDGLLFGLRPSIGMSPRSVNPSEILAPELFATILRRHIWLLRDDSHEDLNSLLEKFSLLPSTSGIKVEENAVVASLTLHQIYDRLNADMFLSSLAESTIAIPLGMSSQHEIPISANVQDVLNTFECVEKLYWENILLTVQKGSPSHFREAALSLVLIRAYQTSLGKALGRGSSIAAHLLDAATAITLRREMLEAIQQKFPAYDDDIQWPRMSLDGEPLSKPSRRSLGRVGCSAMSESKDDCDCEQLDDQLLLDYWNSLKVRYRDEVLKQPSLVSMSSPGLPSNWTVIHINVTEDKDTLFITRQDGGETGCNPTIFRVPLKGRRDNGDGTDEEEHLTFDHAIAELKEIIKLSDEGTKSAIHVKSSNDEARIAWWKQRADLDRRMKELLENIEFCWLGAFKTILSPKPNLTESDISELRVQFSRIFQQSLQMKDTKYKQRHRSHKKATSQDKVPVEVTLDDNLLCCFSTLSPKCRDEELEDLVYFILDLYQFHGVPVATAEVDVVQVVVDLRGVLEEHSAKMAPRNGYKSFFSIPGGQNASISDQNDDEHIFLILDRNIQGIPWESIPILRGRSVSRIPSMAFLHDRIELARRQAPKMSNTVDGQDNLAAVIDPHKGYFVLNPSGDLTQTEERFRTWVKDMQSIGWGGVVGEPVSEQQFLDALRNQDLVVYFGHGGAEQYARSHRIRNLPRCAATMLWGCSSGALRELGDFDRIGTPNSYMLAGCPTLVANLWDVTDRDIDKFSQSVFDILHLNAQGVSERNGRSSCSVVAAVAQSRDTCKLKYLTGAAPVVYGIPFYL